MERKHILIAEDEEKTRRSLAFILKNAGYKVTLVNDGNEALNLLKNHSGRSESIHLLLTDILMPGLTGLELIQELRRVNKSVPVMAISGYGDRETIESLEQQGCYEVIIKPFEPDELLAGVANVLKK